MTTSFRPNIARKYSTVDVIEMPVDSAATFGLNEFVYWDTATQTLKGCGANPALIAGLSLAPAAMGLDTKGSIWGGTKIPVALLKPSSVLFMGGTTPVINNVGVSYDIVNTSGVWTVNNASTGNARAFVHSIVLTPQQEGYLVSLIAANLQFDAIAS